MKDIDGVPVVLAGSHNFKVLRAGISFVAILVVVLISKWAFTDEGFRNENMNRNSFLVHYDSRVFGAAVQFVRLKDQANPAITAGFKTLESRNRFPVFHKFNYITT